MSRIVPTSSRTSSWLSGRQRDAGRAGLGRQLRVEPDQRRPVGEVLAPVRADHGQLGRRLKYRGCAGTRVSPGRPSAGPRPAAWLGPNAVSSSSSPRKSRWRSAPGSPSGGGASRQAVGQLRQQRAKRPGHRRQPAGQASVAQCVDHRSERERFAQFVAAPQEGWSPRRVPAVGRFPGRAWSCRRRARPRSARATDYVPSRRAVAPARRRVRRRPESSPGPIGPRRAAHPADPVPGRLRSWPCETSAPRRLARHARTLPPFRFIGNMNTFTRWWCAVRTADRRVRPGERARPSATVWRARRAGPCCTIRCRGVGAEVQRERRAQAARLSGRRRRRRPACSFTDASCRYERCPAGGSTRRGLPTLLMTRPSGGTHSTTRCCWRTSRRWTLVSSWWQSDPTRLQPCCIGSSQPRRSARPCR